MPMAADTVRYADGFYYWPDYEERDGLYFPIVRFLRIEDHVRARTNSKRHPMPGEFATKAEALHEAEASMHHYSAPGSLAFLWAIYP